MTAPVSARTAAVLALEAAAARGWPAPETAELDGWLLRAADGTFTDRANSAVPWTQAAVDSVEDQLAAAAGLPATVQAIEAWYRERGLPTRLALPVPLMEPLRARLAAHGWLGRGPTLAMVADVAAVLAACRDTSHLPPPVVSDRLDADWLCGYHHGHDVVGALRRAILEGGDARFATLHLDTSVAAVIRTTVTDGWVGIAPVEVAPQHRRQGYAQHLVAWAMRDGLARGATRAWLQVLDDNMEAIALYDRLGFTTHHAYWYVQPSDEEHDGDE